MKLEQVIREVLLEEFADCLDAPNVTTLRVAEIIAERIRREFCVNKHDYWDRIDEAYKDRCQDCGAEKQEEK